MDSYDIVITQSVSSSDEERQLNQEGTVNGMLDSGHFNLTGGTDGEENELELYWNAMGEYQNDNNQGWEEIEFSPIGVDSHYSMVAESMLNLFEGIGFTDENDTELSIFLEDPSSEPTAMGYIMGFMEVFALLEVEVPDLMEASYVDFAVGFSEDHDYLEMVYLDVLHEDTQYDLMYIYENHDEADDVDVPEEVLEEAS